MANVQGKYIVCFSPDMNSWTLSDNSRSESRAPADQDLNVLLLSGKYAGNILYFERNNVLTIKRVMIESNGAAGLRAPLKGFAGIIKTNLKAVTPLEEGCGAFELEIPDYNTWYDVETLVKPFETTPAPDYSARTDKYQPYKMTISNQGSFAYDGYNLSSDYVGQELQPRVIMEIDTAGVYTTSFILV